MSQRRRLLVALLAAGAWLGSLAVANGCGRTEGFKTGRQFELEQRCSAARSFERLHLVHVEPDDVRRHADRACAGSHVLAWELQYNEPLLLELRK